MIIVKQKRQRVVECELKAENEIRVGNYFSSKNNAEFFSALSQIFTVEEKETLDLDFICAEVSS